MSTRARSKLPSGKNILVFGERRRRGVARAAGVGEAGTPFTGLSHRATRPGWRVGEWPVPTLFKIVVVFLWGILVMLACLSAVLSHLAVTVILI